MLLRFLLRFLLTMALLWAMTTYLGTWIVITGGIPAYLVLAAVITLLNMFVLPVLNLLTLPLRFFMTAVAVLLVNGVFLWLTVRIVEMMDPALLTLQIRGGIPGWLIAIIALGVGKWLMKLVVK